MEHRPASRRLVIILTALSVAILFGVYSVIPTWQLPHTTPKHVETPHTQAAQHNEPQQTSTQQTTAQQTSIQQTTAQQTSIQQTTAQQTSTQHSAPQHTDAAATAKSYVTARKGSHWPSWSGVEHLIVFGDSWSSTGFDIDGDVPSDSNPLGNPAYPGATVTNGANWIDYITYNYNDSKIFTVDLAVGGATIDSELIAPMNQKGGLTSFNVQVEKEWETHVWNWSPDNSLFVVWFGVNDITAYNQETKRNFGQEFVEFADLMDQLYARGARNFLVLNCPPMDKSPIFPSSGLPEWLDLIAGWNVNATALTKNLTKTYDDVTTFYFDAWQLFEDVMETPCIFEESCGFEIMTESCKWYAWGTPTPDFNDEKCPHSVDKYLWINALHVTTRMHKTIAKAVSDALRGS